MLRNKQGDLEWLEFELLADHPCIAHGVFLRHGGVSEASFASLNVSKHFGDQSERVEENRRRIANALQLPAIVSTRQIHGIEILHVKAGDVDLSYLEYDGMMTNSVHLGLMAQHADCQAAIIYDPINNAIAILHAGWRGQVKGIYRQIIQEMQRVFHSDVRNLLVCISPSLGPENSEFKNYRLEFPEEFWQFQFKPFYFDLWAITQHQLITCGVLPHHIEIARIDTYAFPDDFFSYRREKANKITGVHGTVVALKHACRYSD